jgi:hypothetical protein
VRLIPPENVVAGAPEPVRRLRLPFRWQVEVRTEGRPHRLGVEPDRVFGLYFEDSPENRRRAFFLEADLGTMPVVRRDSARPALPANSSSIRRLGDGGSTRRALESRTFGS